MSAQPPPPWPGLLPAAGAGDGPSGDGPPDSPLLGWGTPNWWEALLPLNNHSNGYESVRVVKSGPGWLFGFTVYSSKASAQFIQVFDVNRAPAATDIPCLVFTVATGADREFAWLPPRRFDVGIVLANSSAGPTYTAGAADTYFDVQFL